MTPMNMKRKISMMQLLLAVMAAIQLITPAAFAASPGITGTNFQPDGVGRPHQPA